MKIKSIKSAGINPTWDIEVPSGNEYVLHNGCVSHNTASILGNYESFEPAGSNMFKRAVLSGEFQIVNKHLVKKLISLGIWDEKMKNKIMMKDGSIQEIEEIPQYIKDIYKTVWEVNRITYIDMAADRGIYIDQTQSMNVYMENPDFSKMNKMLFYAWKKGLKTGSYYFRTTAGKSAIKFTVESETEKQIDEAYCSIDNPDDCMACSA